MFFVFEGLDGCGKSTLIKNYKALLESEGREVYLTREPGGTPLGEELRDTLLTIKKSQDFKISPRAELLLYEASRAQHVDQIIRPKVTAGEVVLCDRFTASSVAFQALWNSAFSDSKRKLGMNQPLDRLESEKADFHNAVSQSYKEQVDLNPENWLVLDGRLNPSDLLTALVEGLKKFW